MQHLRAQAIECNYKSFLNVVLVDQFICGVIDVGLRKRLLSTDKIMFEEEIKLALHHQMIECDSQQLSTGLNTVSPSTHDID